MNILNNQSQHSGKSKILWRINFLLVNIFKMNFDAILCSLHSARDRRGISLAALLKKRNIIRWDSNNYFYHNKIKFSYINDFPALEFIDNFISNFKYIKKNFYNNSAYIFEGSYEKEDVIIKKGDIIIDAGAHFGFFSMFASSKCDRIFAFEPIKETREIFKKNIVDNNFNNIDVYPFALGEKESNLQISISDNFGESSGFFKVGKKFEEVRQISIDQFIKEHNINKLDFIKADIEGMERHLIEGAKESIKKFRPRLSICTYHREDDPEIIEGLIKKYVPDYKILKTKSKIYAWCN